MTKERYLELLQKVQIFKAVGGSAGPLLEECLAAIEERNYLLIEAVGKLAVAGVDPKKDGFIDSVRAKVFLEDGNEG